MLLLAAEEGQPGGLVRKLDDNRGRQGRRLTRDGLLGSKHSDSVHLSDGVDNWGRTSISLLALAAARTGFTTQS